MEYVELRVHGVHGTSPALMLGVTDGDVHQVAGDAITGVFRSSAPLPLRDFTDPHHAARTLPISVEAYSWGSLTSGVQGFLGWVKRVLWLLLLPFALVNLAYWARLETGHRTGKDRWGARAVRVSGLLLTCFLVLTPCVVAVDMVAWQCYRGGVRRCHVPGQLDLMLTWSPSQRMALCSLLPLLLIGVLWFLSRQSLIRYEEVPGAHIEGTVVETLPDGTPHDVTTDPLLRSRSLWNGKARTERLQRLHLTAAFATVALFSGVHLLVAGSGASSEAYVPTTVLAALVFAAAVAETCRSHPDDLEALDPPLDPDPARPAWPMDVHAQWLALLSALVLAAHLAVMTLSPGHLSGQGDFIGHNVWFIGLFAVLTALHLTVFVGARLSARSGAGVVAAYVVLLLAVLVLHWTHHYPPWAALVAWVGVIVCCVVLGRWHFGLTAYGAEAWNGAGASVLLASATWVALLFTSASVVAAANYLNGPDQGVSDLVARTSPTEVASMPLVVPQVLVWTPIAQLVWLVAVAAALLWCGLRYSRRAGAHIATAVVLDGSLPPVGAAYVPAAQRARQFAGMAHRAERLLGVVGAVTGPLGLAILAFSATGQAPWEAFAALKPIATLSMYVALLISLSFVALGSQIRRSESARKAVGIIWDLTTFWPRAAHPLAPPCYAERVVPELLLRTRWVLRSPSADGDTDNEIILSGHSQGSLIVASAVSRLSDDELERVHLITYGSQIRGLYGRIFPRVFGPDDIGYAATTRPTTLDDPRPDVPDPQAPVAGPLGGSLHDRLVAAGGHWVNLFRRTDPLGYRVFSDGDAIDRVVAEVPDERLGDPGPRVLAHSGYQHSVEYRAAVAEWTGETPVPLTLGTLHVPPLPPV